MDGLAQKFSEKLKEHPINIYIKHDNLPVENNRKTRTIFGNIESVRTDESGTGGSVSINFSYNNWISVRKDKFDGSDFFNPRSAYYKINEESFQNILTMMKELINRSGYSEVEKDNMFNLVVDGLKEEDLKEFSNKEELK